jgi:hypothetical protein
VLHFSRRRVTTTGNKRGSRLVHMISPASGQACLAAQCRVQKRGGHKLTAFHALYGFCSDCGRRKGPTEQAQQQRTREAPLRCPRTLELLDYGLIRCFRSVFHCLSRSFTAESFVHGVSVTHLRVERCIKNCRPAPCGSHYLHLFSVETCNSEL